MLSLFSIWFVCWIQFSTSLSSENRYLIDNSVQRCIYYFFLLYRERVQICGMCFTFPYKIKITLHILFGLCCLNIWTHVSPMGDSLHVIKMGITKPTGPGSNRNCRQNHTPVETIAKWKAGVQTMYWWPHWWI